jgi:hypothetical protein
MLWRIGHNDEAMQTGLQAVRVLADLEPRRELAWTYLHLCQMAAVAQDAPAAATYARQAIACDEHFGEPGLRATGHVSTLRTRGCCAPVRAGRRWRSASTGRSRRTWRNTRA